MSNKNYYEKMSRNFNHIWLTILFRYIGGMGVEATWNLIKDNNISKLANSKYLAALFDIKDESEDVYFFVKFLPHPWHITVWLRANWAREPSTFIQLLNFVILVEHYIKKWTLSTMSVADCPKSQNGLT